MQDLRENQAVQAHKVQEVIQVRKVPVDPSDQLVQEVTQVPGDQPDQSGLKDQLVLSGRWVQEDLQDRKDQLVRKDRKDQSVPKAARDRREQWDLLEIWVQLV